MAQEPIKKDEPGGLKPAEGVSHFLAKVLDQLSLSAWLPAVVLVAAITLMTRLHSLKSLDVVSAVNKIAETKPIGLLVILLLGIVVAALITQAFAFELIRLWEGYWGATAAVLLLGRWRVAHHRHRAQKCRKKRDKRRALALDRALEALRLTALSPAQLDLVRWRANGSVPSDRPKSSWQDRRVALRVDWRDHAPAALLDSEDRWRARLENYPHPSRILPTRLGNTLRAREDRIVERPLERIVMRRYLSIPPRLLTRHDQFRDRVEMYAVLTTVSVILALGAVPLLAPCAPDWRASIGGSLLFALLGVISYSAAVSSAGGYGAVLAQIAELPADTPENPALKRSFIARTISWLGPAA